MKQKKYLEIFRKITDITGESIYEQKINIVP
jgi:hypothetical protein